MGWMYISFVTGDGADERFAGGCIVRGDDTLQAVSEAWAQKCNPGGQALCVPVPDDSLPAEKYRNRLMQKEEIDECWDDCVRLGDYLDEQEIDASCSAVKA